jgi:serine/threonine-protein kinase
MNAAQPPVQPGDILAGKYRVDRVLGMGGMGVVVAATHLDLQEPRAIKFMLPSALPDGEAVERFLREARATSRLRSEHVARVYDVGRLDNGAPYMVMECLEGADLNATLKRGGALHHQLAILYVLQTAEALAEAHGRGIVHRDLKPANLFLSTREDGTPCIKVLDFGISKFAGASGLDGDLGMATATHVVLGSPHYMSPEQMHSSRAVDARSDIWSLGVILYQLVTGRLPFRGRSITEIIAVVLEGMPPRPSDLMPGHLPQGLDPVILRCLERDLSRRYANVGELAQGLLPFAPPGAGVAVDRILRSIASPSRTATGLPMVAVPEGQLPPGLRAPVALDPLTVREAGSSPSHAALAMTPQHAPITGALAGPPSGAGLPPPGAIATGAWGSTSVGRAPLRSRAPLVVLGVGAAFVVGGLVAWTVATSGPHPAGGPVVTLTGSAGADPPAPTASAPPTAPAASAAPTASTTPTASADPAPSATPPATSSAASSKARKAPGRQADPFGMDRK